LISIVIGIRCLSGSGLGIGCAGWIRARLDRDRRPANDFERESDSFSSESTGPREPRPDA
jgi:hypothetical protein